MDLKTLLGEELAGKVQAVLDKHNEKAEKKAKLVDLSEGGYVSVEKYNTKKDALEGQIKDLQGQAATRDKDLAALQEQLKNADPEKIDKLQGTIDTLQQQYVKDKADYEATIAKQAYEFAVKEEASKLQFSSNAAKKAFISEAIAKEFKLDGDMLLGYKDWLAAYKEADPTAFAAQADPAPQAKQPSFTKPAAPETHTSGPINLAEMMAKANADPSYVPKFD